MPKSLLDTDILSEYLKGHDRTVTRRAADYLRAASIKAAVRKQGSIVELPDCLIAAVAARLDLPLATGNTEDFQAIQRTGLSLRIENWRDP
jgi:predicted nucleic acid-binding protein